MKESLRQPMCIGCPHNLHYLDSIPQKKFGVMMHCGEHFCTVGKRARRFKKRDPQSHVPDWCPMRKTPCQLRVYALKSLDDWYLHSMLDEGVGKGFSPSAHRYAKRLEGTIELSPHEFWRRCKVGPADDILPVSMRPYEVLEIDDGLEPAFFYKDKAELRLIHSFDAGRARKNTMDTYSDPSGQ